MSTELSLLQRALDFDEQALAEIYDHFSPKLHRYAVRLLGDDDVAEDCVAETFSRFLKSLRNGNGPKSYLQAYLYRIAHNWITDYYRRQPPPALSLDVDIQLAGDANPQAELSEKLEREQVRAALLLLTPEQRQVVLLKFLEDFDNQEIAQAMDKPVGAVKALQHRGINALRRLLLKEEIYE